MAEDLGPPYGQEITLHPQAPGSVATPESLQVEQSLANRDQLVTVLRPFGLQFDGEIDAAVFSNLVQRIQDHIAGNVSARNLTDMRETFLSWTRLESGHGQEPRDLDQLFQAVAQERQHVQIVYLQGLLIGAGRQDLCKGVQSMVETTAAGTLRIPYICFTPLRTSYPDLRCFW